MEDWVKYNWGFILFVVVMVIIVVTPHLIITCPHYEQPRVIIEVQTKYVGVHKCLPDFADLDVCPCGSNIRIDLCHGKQVLEYFRGI